MIAVGIDPSLTSTGVAILHNGQPTHVSHHGYGAHGDGHNGKTWQLRNRRVRYQTRLIHQAATTHGRPDLVVIEEHPYAAKAFGAEFDRSFLWGKIFEAFDWPEIPIAVINPSTLKVWVTGQGAVRDSSLSQTQRQKLNKQRMIDAITAWWPHQPIACDDEADALGLAAIGAFHLGDPMPFEVKPRHTTGLEKVSWPEIARAR